MEWPNKFDYWGHFILQLDHSHCCFKKCQLPLPPLWHVIIRISPSFPHQMMNIMLLFSLSPDHTINIRAPVQFKTGEVREKGCEEDRVNHLIHYCESLLRWTLSHLLPTFPFLWKLIKMKALVYLTAFFILVGTVAGTKSLEGGRSIDGGELRSTAGERRVRHRSFLSFEIWNAS